MQRSPIAASPGPRRRAWWGAAPLTLCGGLAAATLAVPGQAATAAEAGPALRLAGGSPFAGCTADGARRQEEAVNYPNTATQPWVAANPADPDHLIAGWIQDRWSDGGGRGNVSAHTRDGGRTWTAVEPTGVTACGGGSYPRATDPWISIAPDGTAYFLSLGTSPSPTSGGFGPNGVLVSRSADGGRTWGPPTTLSATSDPQVLHDKPSVTADRADPAFAYAVWDRLQDFTMRSAGTRDPRSAAPPTGDPAAPVEGGGAAPAPEVGASPQAGGSDDPGQRRVGEAAQAPPGFLVQFEGPAYMARTTDGGRSWEPARVIHDPGPNAQTINNRVEVLPDGTVVNLFTEITPNRFARIGLLRSADKGRTFEGPPTYATAIFSTGTITPDLQETVRDSTILFDSAVDRRDGRLYLVWQDNRFRGVEEVAFAQSTDGGRTWSEPVRVNKTPANPADPLRQQAFHPQVEVAANGALVVTHYDFRNDGDERGERTDYWAITCAGGCTDPANWGDEVRLTEQPMNMVDAPESRGRFLGDYVGLAAAGDVAHPIFALTAGSNVTDVYTRRLGLNGMR